MLLGSALLMGFIFIFFPPFPPPPDTDAPGQVQNLHITAWPWGNTLNLTWDANTESDLDHYNIYRSTTPSFTPGPANLIVALVENHYSDTGLIDGQFYYYRVTAVDANSNEGPPSNEGSERPQDSAAPTKVTGVIVTVVPTGNTLNISWDTNTAPDLVEYGLYRSIVPGFTVDLFNPDVRVSTNHYLDTSLTDDTPYYYRIAAIDEVPNYGTPSDQANGTPQDTLPPGQVSGVTITNPQTGNQLDLSWDASSDPDVVGYNVYRGSFPNFTIHPVYLVGITPSTSHQDTGLIDGNPYYYKVTAYDEVPNEGPPSIEISGVSTNSIPPNKVTGLTISVIPEGNSLYLAWTACPAVDFDHYRIYRSVNSGFIPNSSTLIATPSTNYYQDIGLTDNLPYYYRVSSVDWVPNEGEPSDQANETPHDSEPPAKVVGVSPSILPNGSLSLSWTANTEPDLANYKVYRSNISGFTPGPASLIATPLSNSYVDNPTDPYYYKVSAVDEVPNEGTPSDEFGSPPDTTPPPKVTGVVVTVIPTGNTLNLTWSPSAAPDLINYKVYRSTTIGFIPSGGNLIASPLTSQYLDSGLTDDTTYYYRISAVDEVPNEGTYSDEASGTPSDTQPPGQVLWTFITPIATGNGISLGWNPKLDLDLAGYRLYRSTVFTGPYSFLVDVIGQESYDDTGLIDGITYYYKISAYDEVPNYGINSSVQSATPQDTIPPAKVTGVAITVVPAGNALNLTWTASAATDLANYKIFRSTTSGFTPGGGNLIASPLTSQYLDSGLTDGTTYYYRISAVDEVPNEGTYSDEASGTPQDPLSPAKVVGVSVAVAPAGNALSLSWTANTEPDLTNYKVYRSTTPGFTPGPPNLVGTPGSNSYSDSALTDDVIYYYRITAVDEVPNEGMASDEVNGTPHDSEAPAKVLGVSISVITTGNQLNLTWTASAATDLANYKVYRSTTPVFTPNGTNLIASPATNQYLDSGLIDGISYYYRISAVDEVPNEGTYSDESSCNPCDTVAPDQVTGLGISVVPEGNAVSLSWDASTAPDFVEYWVYRSTTSGGPYTNIVNRTTNSYTDSGRTDGTTYYYIVLAVDEVPNEGDASDEASGIPADSVAPSKVTGVIYNSVPTGNAINITWTANPATDLDHYNIYRSTVPGFTPQLSNLVASPSTNNYLDTNLTDGILYYYRISALDEVPNEGTYSDEATGVPLDTTPPPQVIGVNKIMLPTGNAINLQWTDLSGSTPDLEGYRIYRSTTSGFTPGPSYYIGNTTNNYYNDTGLVDGVDYYYKITAFDEVPNEGTASVEATGTPHDSTPPEKVVGVTIIDLGLGNSLNITWTASNESDLTNYKIYRTTTPGFTPNMTNLIASPVINYYLDSGLSNGITYYYIITAVDEVPNESPPSDEASGAPS